MFDKMSACCTALSIDSGGEEALGSMRVSRVATKPRILTLHVPQYWRRKSEKVQRFLLVPELSNRSRISIRLFSPKDANFAGT